MIGKLFDRYTNRVVPVTRQSSLVRYGIAIIAVACTALSIHYIHLIGGSGRGGLMLFSFTITAVTFWVGFYPGLLALILAIVGINTLLLIEVWRTQPYDALILNAGFCVLSAIILAKTYSYQRQARLLWESKQDLKLAQFVGQIGSWRLNLQRNKLSWSDENYKIYGVPKDLPLTYEFFLSKVHPDDQEYVNQQWQAALLGENYDLEHRIVVDGKTKWLREKAILEFDRKGKLLGGFGITQDISAEKQSEQALQNLLDRYELVLNGAQDAIWDWDTLSNTVHYSSRWKSLRGYSVDDDLYDVSYWKDSIHPDDADRIMAAIAAHFEGKTPVFNEEYRIHCQDGTWKWILDRGIAKWDEYGRVVRMAGSENDITDRKNAEAELRNQEKELQAIIDTTPALISYLDINFTYLRVNKTYEKWFGLKKEDIIGRQAKDVIGQAAWNRVRAYLEQAQRGQEVSFDLEIPYGKGKPRWVHATYCPNKDTENKVIGIVVHVADIDDRKRTEQEIDKLNQSLQHSIEEMQTIFDAAPIGLSITNDIDGKHIRGNRMLEQMIGLPWHSELSLRAASPQAYKVFSGERQLTVDELPMQRAIRGDTINSQMLDIQRPDGRKITLLTNAVPLFSEQGSPRGAVGAFLDVTALKNAETALRNSEERLRLARKAGALGIYDYNLVTGEIQWDDRILEMWGLKPGQAATLSTLLACVHPDDYAKANAAVKKSFDPKGNGEYHAEYRVIRPFDNRVIWVASYGIASFANNQAIRLVGYAQDINERKRAESKLRDTELRLTLALEELNAGYWDWDLKTDVVYFSPEWKHQLGFADNELPNRYEEWENRLHTDDRVLALETVRSHLNGILPNYEVEFRLQHKDGSYRWIHSRGKLIRDQDNQPSRMVGIHLDITDFIKVKDLNLQREQMEESFRLNVASQTVAAIAHELNQPLTAISYLADASVTMLQSGNKNPQKLGHVLQTCSEQAQRAGQVIRQLMAVLQKGELISEPVDINKMVNLAYEYIKNNNYLNEFKFAFNLAPDLPEVLTYSLQIQKILIVLFHNSLEAMRENGNLNGTVTVTTCRYAVDPKMAIVTVSDQGVGVHDVASLSKMFQPFFSTKPTGLGMGLAISRNLIEAHGGKMWAEQNPDIGISVNFTLPLAL